jgi:hypothetical protein
LPAAALTSKPSSRSPAAAESSFSGRRAATVSAWPSSPSIRAIASPIPLEPPVTMAARSAMPFLLTVGCGAAFHHLCLHSGGVRRPLLWISAPLLAAAVAAGCGGSKNDDSPPPQPEPTGQPADFPAANGKSFDDLASMAEGKGPVLAPSVFVLHKGENRFGFGLFDTARKQISGVEVALYTARSDGSGVRGPYVARSESLAVRPQFQSQTTASDPNSAKSVYVADVPFKRTGKQAVIAIAKLDGRLLVTNGYGIDVTKPGSGPPNVGDRAVKVHTQTLTDVGGDGAQLDTRRPVAKDLLEEDLADVLGKRPVVITFATPLLCQSRVCGPVVDIVEQVKASAPKGVAFIHQEIYANNKVDDGLRPQVTKWGLRTEPWTFVIDRSGRISTRFEGAFSVGELQRAVAKVSSGT